MRREQNLALVGAVVSAAVITTGLLLLLVARVNPDAGSRMRGVMLDLVTPVWSVVRAPFDGAGRAASWTSDYFGAVSRNRTLTADLARADAQLQKAAADQLALKQLRALMNVQEPGRTPVATTRLVAATSGSVVRSAMVGAGARDGVGVGMPVIAAQGLIGRIIETGNHAGRVLLLTDPASRVPVVIQRTGQAALAVGRNSPALELSDRVGAEVPLRTGDRLVTSGDGGIFPPGVPVGSIIAGGVEPPRIRPAASPMGTGFVVIEAAWLPLPAEPVEPRSDAPVPVEARRASPSPKLPVKPAPLP
jgi:rod shape-determining protein MreC